MLFLGKKLKGPTPFVLIVPTSQLQLGGYPGGLRPEKNLLMLLYKEARKENMRIL